MRQPEQTRLQGAAVSPQDAGKGSLQLKQVRRTFGSVTALHGLDLDILAGEFLTVLGPSGSGKTTMLNMVAGFDYPTAGQILIANRDVTWEPSYSRDIGMVFQNYALFPHMTVFENIAFPLRARRRPAAAIDTAVMHALALVQMEEMGQRLPRQLSGGQQQRVALARSFVYRPAVLLMDEPLGALDRQLRADMQVEIKRLHRDLGMTIIYVTHDQDEALSMSDRIAILHSGRLEQCASPREIYANPASKFVAGFIGEASFFPATVENTGEAFATLDHLAIRIPLVGSNGFPAGSRVTICVRPENIRLTAPRSAGSQVRLDETLYLGDSIKCILRFQDMRIVAKVPLSHSAVIPPVQGEVGLEINAGGCTIFPEKS